jgi:hypothetical protein
MGLRPGRPKDKLSADRGNADSTFSAAAGYRAAGMVSPVREAPKSDAMATGGGALSQFSADAGPKVPKAPGLLQTVGSAAASHVGGKVLEKGVDKLGQTTAGRYVDHTMSGSSIPFSAMEAANASPDSIEYLDSRGYFDAPNNAPVVDASGLGEYAVLALAQMDTLTLWAMELAWVPTLPVPQQTWLEAQATSASAMWLLTPGPRSGWHRATSAARLRRRPEHSSET